MSDKKRGPNLKETLEEKKKKLEAMKARNRTAAATGEPSRSEISNVTNLDDALKLAESLTGRKAEIASPEPVRREVKQESSSQDSTPATTTPVVSRRRAGNLVMKFDIAVTDIPPKERETYSKSTQTSTESGEDVESHQASSPSVPKEIVHAESSLLVRNKSISEESNHNVQASTSADTEQKELTQDEKDAIVTSSDFVSWFSKTSKLVERALYATEQYDITVDYSAIDESSDRRENRVREVTLEAKLFDERWSKHRAVTDIAWSPKFADLVVASYSANEQGGNDPDGVVLVWSVHNALQRPEFRFHCQSPVVSVFFDEFSPTLVVGGTYSGQIVLWDTRAKTTPIQHTPLSSVGHTHPVYSMDIVGSKNAHNLVTVSTDGKLCVWNLENLLQPLEVLELHNKQSKQVTVTAPVAVTSLAFPEAEVNSFFVGSEEGAVYEAYRHGGKQGIYERYDGHHGPITSIDFHNGTGAINFSDLFITASTDWTCKLWSQKHGQKPIYSFEGTGDYVYDARWCPSHPAVFATVDGTGSLDLWNLNEETEIPILHTPISQRALNKIRWSADGKRILAGDADGALHIYGTGELSVPRADEWTVFEETLSKLMNLDEDAANGEKKEALL